MKRIEKLLVEARRQWLRREEKKMKIDPFLKAQERHVLEGLDGKKVEVAIKKPRQSKGITLAAIPKFTKWLVANGAEILVLTNQYEVLRMRTERGVSVVYRNKAHKITSITNDAKEAWRCYTMGLDWRAFVAVKRQKSSIDEETIRARDGDLCFFCWEPLNDDATIEHLVARTHGGPNHISNKFLAHKQCNCDAGHLSAPEKIELRLKNYSMRQVRERVLMRLDPDTCPF